MGASPDVQHAVAAVKDIEASALLLAQDLKYPIDAHGRILDMNHLPDVLVALTYHLIKCGWRRDESKRMIKQRRVVGAGYYQDLVTYVDVNETDAPIVIERDSQPAQEIWSVTPQVNVIDEPRPAE